jgi:hypothetical protein
MIGTILGFSLFPLIIIFPGYVFGWLFDLFEFRLRRLHTRLAISLLLSIAISPILYYLVTSWLSLSAALIVTFLILLTFIVLLIRDKPTLPQNRRWLTLFGTSLGWITFALLLLVDLQWGNRELYFNVASLDHTTRVSVIDAMTRTGVPPINPSYYPGHSVKLTFLYFFWYILGSIIDIAGGSLVDARTAFFASIIWCGLALIVMIAFYLRQRERRVGRKIWQYTFVGIASLLITGLDILPTLVFMRLGNGIIGDLEHWNEQITAWVGSLLWVPHHVASLIAGFVGIMLVHSVRGLSPKKQFVAFVFSGVAFASAFGLSVWVTFVFVLFWGIWMLFIYTKKDQRALFFLMLLSGIVALTLAGPFLLGLLSGNDGGDTGLFPIALTVRSFLYADAYFENSSLLWKYMVRLSLLPLNYFFELGFFALVAFIWLKAKKSDIRANPYYFSEVLLLGTSFFIGTFTRSTLIENNDLGWRAWLPGQFILLIWSVDVFRQFTAPSQKKFNLPPTTKYNLVVLVALGFATTVLDVALLRFGYNFAFGSEAGRQIYSARQAYTAINQILSEDVIVQYNPSNVLNRPIGLYGMHQSAISDRTAYGVPIAEYNAKVAAVSEIFDMQNARSWDPLDTLCGENFIDVIVVVDSDPLWKSLGLLMEKRQPLYSNDYYAVFACGNHAASLTP